LKVLRVAACAFALSFPHAGGAAASMGSPAAMQARYVALKQAPGHGFHRPLHLLSSESPTGLSGEIHAILDHPFSTTATALNKPSQWCDVLILHLNTKYCQPSVDGQGALLHLRIGKKHDQPMEQAYRVDFAYRVAVETANYLQVTLTAGEGPLGTSDYRIALEATPAARGRTLIRLSYSYAFGVVGRLAMKAYLGTAGRDKVGFTLVGSQADGKPLYIGGMRGVVERNTMRYFLAIEAHLGALSVPAPGQMEKSLRDWFAGSERYPRQLHEMEQGEYLVMKRREYLRQQSG
jgi:hypothetical protein